jgi:hypothetical protein
MSQKRASSLISQGNCMKRNVEFIEVVVHYNEIKIIFESNPEWVERKVNRWTYLKTQNLIARQVLATLTS